MPHRIEPHAPAISSPRATRPLLHSFLDAQKQLGGLGRSTIYELIATGKLEACKFGRKTLVTDASLRRLVNSLQRGVDGPKGRRTKTA